MQQKKSRLRVDVDDEKGNVLNKTVEGIWKEIWHNSVTRLGEISSFQAKKIKVFGYCSKALSSIWQYFEPTWAYYYWANFHCCKWSNIEK